MKYKYPLLLLTACIIGYFQITFFIYTPKWDNINAFLPYRHIVGTWVASGHLPLWNPYQLLGYPMHADPQSGAWYPITWLLSLLNNYDFYSINLELSIHYYLSGLGMFLLGKNLSLKSQIAFIMGLTYMFSGFMVGTSQILGMIIAAAWLPWSVNYLISALRNPSFKNIFILSVINSFLVTGSYPAMTIVVFYFYLFVGFYYLFQSCRNLFSYKRLILLYTSLAIIMLLILGPYLYSIYEALPFMTRANALPYTSSLFGSVGFSIQSFLSFIFPYGTVANTEFFESDVSMTNAYFGIFGLILVASGLVYSKDKKVLLPFIIAIAFILLAAGIQLPFHYFVYKYVPGFDLFRHPSLFRVYAIFLLIISLGFSIRYFSNLPEKLNRLDYILRLTIILLILVVIAGALFTDYSIMNAYKKAFLSFEEKSPLNLAGHIFIQGIIQLIIVITAYLYSRKKTLTLSKFCCLICIDLLIATQLNAPRTIYYSLPFDGFQEYYETQPKALTNQTLDDKVIDINNENIPEKKSAVYDNLNSFAKRTAYDGYNPFKMNSFLKLGKSGFMNIILDNPIFYFPDTIYIISANPDPVDVPGKAFLSNEYYAKYQDKIGKGKLENLNINYNGFSIEAEVQSDGLIFFNQNYNDNWQLSLNGKKMEIIKANISLMAFEVPKGKHEIQLNYRSKAIEIAFIVSAITIVIGLLIIFILAVRSRN